MLIKRHIRFPKPCKYHGKFTWKWNKTNNQMEAVEKKFCSYCYRKRLISKEIRNTTQAPPEELLLNQIFGGGRHVRLSSRKKSLTSRRRSV